MITIKITDSKKRNFWSRGLKSYLHNICASQISRELKYSKYSYKTNSSYIYKNMIGGYKKTKYVGIIDKKSIIPMNEKIYLKEFLIE